MINRKRDNRALHRFYVATRKISTGATDQKRATQRNNTADTGASRHHIRNTNTYRRRIYRKAPGAIASRPTIVRALTSWVASPHARGARDQHWGTTFAGNVDCNIHELACETQLIGTPRDEGVMPLVSTATPAVAKRIGLCTSPAAPLGSNNQFTAPRRRPSPVVCGRSGHGIPASRQQAGVGTWVGLIVRWSANRQRAAVARRRAIQSAPGAVPDLHTEATSASRAV